jgi:hypothetical protein
MLPRSVHRERTTLDVMDRVLDKGIVVETGSEVTDRASARGITGIGLFVVDARVTVATDVDPTLTDDVR